MLNGFRMGNNELGHTDRGPSAKSALFTAIAISFASAAGTAGALTDEEVLAQFGRVTDLPLPQITQSAGGATQLVWTTSLDLNAYRNTQTGGAALNPNTSGSRHRLSATTDYRRVTEGDITTWAQTQVTQTNDLTMQRHPLLINRVQVGYSQPGFVGAVGDLAVSHSTLGSQLPLRGVQAQKYFGPIIASGAAGLFAEDWKSAFITRVRTAYPRESYAVKLSTAPDAFAAAFNGGMKGIELFATAQHFIDQTSSTAQSPLILFPLNKAKGSSATTGLSFRRDQIAFNVEGGKSRFDEEGNARLKDDAFMTDFSWQGDPVSLRLGHHNIGVNYATLAMIAPGTRETFGNVVWRASATLSASLDARKSRYVPNSRSALLAPPPITPVQPVDPFGPPVPAVVKPPVVVTDSQSASLTLNYVPQFISGFNTSLTVGRAKTEQLAADTRTETDNASFSANYSVNGWSANLNLTDVRNDTFGANPFAAKTSGLTLNLGKSLSDSTGQRSMNAMLSYMKQWQENSATLIQPMSKGWNDRWMFTLGLNWVNVGMFNASAYLGHLKDPLSGAIGKQEGAQLDLTWTITPKWNARIFGRENRNWIALQPQSYKDRSVGASLVGSF